MEEKETMPVRPGNEGSRPAYAGGGFELAKALLAVDELNRSAYGDVYGLEYEEMPPRWEIDLDRWDYADGPIPEHYLPSLTHCNIYVKRLDGSDDLSDFEELFNSVEKENQAFTLLAGPGDMISRDMPFESAASVINSYLAEPPATRDLRRKLARTVERELWPVLRDRDNPEIPLELLDNLHELLGSYVEVVKGTAEQPQ